MLIAPIVEGHGEVRALPRLLRRIAAEAAPAAPLQVNEPIRIKSGSFFSDNEYQSNYVALAAAKVRQANGGIVLILLDCEDNCPAELGPKLHRRAQAVTGNVAVVVALAFREYETWFMAALESLRGVHGLDLHAISPADPETTRDAKGWIGRLMPHGYDPITDQLPFTNALNLAAARRIPSFDRLYRKIAHVVTAPA
jgi:hypothetical protein